MEKIFVVSVDNFELRLVAEMLKRNRKELIITKEGRISDQVNKKIEKDIKNKKQIIFVGFKPEKGEWLKYYSNVSPKYEIIIYENENENKKQKTILKRVEKIVAQDILSDFEKVVENGIRGCGIFSMSLMADELGYRYLEDKKQKMIKNAIKGKALYKGVSRKAWEDAEIAVENKKEVGKHLIVVEYNYKNYEPILDLIYEYCNLLILNKKEEKGILLTYNRDLIKVVQASANETWTHRPDSNSKYRVTIWGDLYRVEKEASRLLLHYYE